MDNRLKELRTAQGLALRGLNVACGVSTSTLSAIEKWKYVPALETRRRIAAALEVQVDDVWPECLDL